MCLLCGWGRRVIKWSSGVDGEAGIINMRGVAAWVVAYKVGLLTRGLRNS